MEALTEIAGRISGILLILDCGFATYADKAGSTAYSATYDFGCTDCSTQEKCTAFCLTQTRYVMLS